MYFQLNLISYQFSSVQLLSCVWLFATPWIAAHQASLFITNSRSSHRLASIESVMPSSHLILCRPLRIRVFSNESTLRMRWPKYWNFSFSIIPFKEIPGLISFRMDCLDLLAVQGTLKSLLQHHSSKASILWRSLGKCKSKLQLDLTSCLLKWLALKRKEITIVGKDSEKRKPWCTVDGKVNWCITYGKQCGKSPQN